MKHARTHAATPDMEQCYQEMVAAIGKLTVRYPSIRNIELIALIGRMAGYCVAMCFPDERDLARQTAIENLDHAVSDVAQQGPARAGVIQP